MLQAPPAPRTDAVLVQGRGFKTDPWVIAGDAKRRGCPVISIGSSRPHRSPQSTGDLPRRQIARKLRNVSELVAMVAISSRGALVPNASPGCCTWTVGGDDVRIRERWLNADRPVLRTGDEGCRGATGGDCSSCRGQPLVRYPRRHDVATRLRRARYRRPLSSDWRACCGWRGVSRNQRGRHLASARGSSTP